MWNGMPRHVEFELSWLLTTMIRRLRIVFLSATWRNLILSWIQQTCGWAAKKWESQMWLFVWKIHDDNRDVTCFTYWKSIAILLYFKKDDKINFLELQIQKNWRCYESRFLFTTRSCFAFHVCLGQWIEREDKTFSKTFAFKSTWEQKLSVVENWWTVWVATCWLETPRRWGWPCLKSTTFLTSFFLTWGFFEVAVENCLFYKTSRDVFHKKTRF